MENVLVTEVLQVLDLLPRDAFLGEILRAAHGSRPARAQAAAGIETALVDVLPGGADLAPGGPNSQPDAYLRMPGATVLVEAKRLRFGSFQPEQLAREYLTLMRDHSTPCRLLLLVIPEPPPIRVKGTGRVDITSAIAGPLPAVHAHAANPPALDKLMSGAEDTYAWITWAALGQVVSAQEAELKDLHPSVAAASMHRMCRSITRSIAWHS